MSCVHLTTCCQALGVCTHDCPPEDRYRIDLVILEGEQQPSVFPTEVAANGPMEAWACACALLDRTVIGPVTVLSYRKFYKITAPDLEEG